MRPHLLTGSSREQPLAIEMAKSISDMPAEILTKIISNLEVERGSIWDRSHVGVLPELLLVGMARASNDVYGKTYPLREEPRPLDLYTLSTVSRQFATAVRPLISGTPGLSLILVVIEICYLCAVYKKTQNFLPWFNLSNAMPRSRQRWLAG